jgi:23S rRNA pseudouridine1911/1915/1917 synthase
MPFVLKEIPAIRDIKIQAFFRKHTDYTLGVAQKLITKGRIFDANGKAYKMSELIRDDTIKVATFEGHTRGLNPLFETEDFAIFDKPSGLMVHPISKDTKYSLLDEIRYHFGEDANLAHRIDLETSGLIMCSKDKSTDIMLKTMFEEKLYQKTYHAIVRGEVKDNITINSPLAKDTRSFIGVKMCVDNEKGKESLTYIKPLKYNANLDQTLVEAKPVTGRQHQIRIHLHSIGHTIIGDPIYGVDEIKADLYLRKKLKNHERREITGADRLMLHALALEFNFKKRTYTIKSKQNFGYNEQ